MDQRNKTNDTRQQIQDGVDRRRREYERRNHEVGEVADDVETEARTLDAMSFEAAGEDAERIRQLLENARDLSVRAFEDEGQELQESQSEGTLEERDLDERGDRTRADADQAREGSADANRQEAKDGLAEVEEAARDAATFLAEQEAEAKDARESSEATHEDDRQRVQSVLHR
ncbi:MAG: hypothetical protein AAGH88_09065 [Planctomycetota bacterium]